MALIPLSQIKAGDMAVVVSIRCEPALRSRLNELGLLPGSRIRCDFPSVFGDPRAYQLRGTMLAIRNRDAEGILCETT